LKEGSIKPQIVKKDQKEDVVPLDLVKYEDFEKTYYSNFNEACDEFYSKKVNTSIKDVKEAAWNKKVNKFEKRLSLQQETLDNFAKTIEDSQHKGEIIYSNYPTIENIINVVNSARGKDYSFKEIGKTLKKAKKDGMAEAQIYESIDKLGVLTLKIDDTTLNIDPKLTIPENAENYYEKTLISNLDLIINYGELIKDLDRQFALEPEIIKYEEYDSKELMNKELNICGFYLTNNPVTNLKIKHNNIVNLNEIDLYFETHLNIERIDGYRLDEYLLD
jgi:predicted ribosome quality control (RQC) complex YloA/Tae2 family protein